MPKKAAKPGQIEPKKRTPYTPPPVQLRVIERHVNGESNREIARQEGIGRDTVSRILSQQEIVQRIAQCQAKVLDLVPEAINVYAKALASDDLHLAAATATKILEGMHVFSKGGIEETIALANKVSPEEQAAERTLHILAQIVDDSIHKDQLFNHPLDPRMEDMKKELDRRMELEHSRY